MLPIEQCDMRKCWIDSAWSRQVLRSPFRARKYSNLELYSAEKCSPDAARWKPIDVPHKACRSAARKATN